MGISIFQIDQTQDYQPIGSQNQSNTQKFVTMSKQRNLVVFDGNPSHNWPLLFKDCKLPDGSTIYVVQASWMECECVLYHDTGTVLKIAPIHESSGKIKRPDVLTVKPGMLSLNH